MASSTAPKPGTVPLAVLEQGGRRWTGRLAPPVVGGPPQLAFTADDGPERLALGSQVHLEVLAPHADVGRTSTARLTAVAHLPSVVLLEVDAENPQLWAEVMPGPVGQPADRRQWPRLEAPSVAALVPVEIDVGPPSARQFAARVVDQSEEGVGLRFVIQAEPHLCRAGRLHVTLQSPDGEPLRHLGRVRHRRLLPSGVRYGVLIEGPSETSAITHEAQWTCTSCGETPLLADRHAHCLACGKEREPARSQLPAWNQLILASEHPFTGVERTCMRCGCAWSVTARNCGHCGTLLPIDQTRPG